MNDDTSRCHYDGCAERENCQRWIYRNDKGDRIVHSECLFPYDIPISDPCPIIIEVDKSPSM